MQGANNWPVSGRSTNRRAGRRGKDDSVISQFEAPSPEKKMFAEAWLTVVLSEGRRVMKRADPAARAQGSEWERAMQANRCWLDREELAVAAVVVVIRTTHMKQERRCSRTQRMVSMATDVIRIQKGIELSDVK